MAMLANLPPRQIRHQKYVIRLVRPPDVPTPAIVRDLAAAQQEQHNGNSEASRTAGYTGRSEANARSPVYCFLTVLHFVILDCKEQYFFSVALLALTPNISGRPVVVSKGSCPVPPPPPFTPSGFHAHLGSSHPRSSPTFIGSVFDLEQAQVRSTNTVARYCPHKWGAKRKVDFLIYAVRVSQGEAS